MGRIFASEIWGLILFYFFLFLFLFVCLFVCLFFFGGGLLSEFYGKLIPDI